MPTPQEGLDKEMAFATVADAFLELLTRIELNPARVTLASQRYNAVKTTIENALPGKTVSQIGSFQRKTKIKPADLGDALDIDAVISFGGFYRYAGVGESGTTPSNALETVRRALVSEGTLVGHRSIRNRRHCGSADGCRTPCVDRRFLGGGRISRSS